MLHAIVSHRDCFSPRSQQESLHGVKNPAMAEEEMKRGVWERSRAVSYVVRLVALQVSSHLHAFLEKTACTPLTKANLWKRKQSRSFRSPLGSSSYAYFAFTWRPLAAVYKAFCSEAPKDYRAGRQRKRFTPSSDVHQVRALLEIPSAALV